jgi:hypothetical protein
MEAATSTAAQRVLGMGSRRGPDGILLFSGPGRISVAKPMRRRSLDVPAVRGEADRPLGAPWPARLIPGPFVITARCTDPHARSLLEAWGIYRLRPMKARPHLVGRLDAAERRGMQHVGFMGQRRTICPIPRTRRDH